jgi:hypothetical protein
VKQADIPSGHEGGEFGRNSGFRANRSMKVRLLPLQLVKPKAVSVNSKILFFVFYT